MSAIVDAAVAVAVILASALLAARTLRARSAALRHWLLAMAVAAAALAPVASATIPEWPVVLLNTTPAADAGPKGSRAIGDAPAAVTIVRSAAAAVWPDAAAIVAGVWMLGTAGCAAFLLAGFARLAALARRAPRCRSPRWLEMAEAVAREHGLRRPLALLETPEAALLVTWGFYRPQILLPAGCADWTAERIRVVLRHEIAHIARGDWTFQMLAECLRCVYWFNPLTWLACRRLRDESEHACDDAVLAHVAPDVYARHLLELARLFASERRTWAIATAMARPRSLERRITVITQAGVNRTPPARGARIAIAAAVLAVACAISAVTSAQDARARLYGTVTDPAGMPLSDATVALTHAQTTSGHAKPTDESGAFDIDGLLPGEYTLEIRAVGFETARQSIVLDSGIGVRRDVRLRLGTIQESIAVWSGREIRKASRTPLDVARFLDKFRGTRLQPPVKLEDVRPEYPQALREAGIGGDVVLEGTLATDGSVQAIRVVSAAHEQLARAAEDAVRRWRFEPTRLWGVAVDTGITMSFRFHPGEPR